MVRADMDGLPVKEKSGLNNASTATMKDWDGNTVNVMHACGHDVHITSLVGTARRIAAMRDQWSGTVMLIGQPAEERGPGASAMMADNLYDRFGKPDYAFAFHVDADGEAGKITVDESSPYAGADTIDITVHGVGAHGAYPHQGKDPVVIASQIVLNLQTIVSRELAPRDAGVITMGAFHSGTKHNIISNEAKLQLTVRSLNPRVREQLLSAIKRVTIGTARTAGMPDDKLPVVVVGEDSYPPTFNDVALAQRLKSVLSEKMGADIERAAAGGPAVPSHHSPGFKISPEPSIKAGVEATVHALMDLMPKDE